MMLVCRGKIIESPLFSIGFPFSVFMVGIPYFLVNDARVLLKKSYLD